MFEGLTEELSDALHQAYGDWKGQHLDDDVYSIGIATSPLAESAGEVFMSEQGLLEKAKKYQQEFYPDEDLRSVAEGLRWSAYDSPFCLKQLDLFEAVNLRLAQISEVTYAFGDDDPEFDAHIGKLYEVFTGALNRFRELALGGDPKIVLMVWTGDCSEEEFDWFLRRSNGPELVESFYKQAQ